LDFATIKWIAEGPPRTGWERGHGRLRKA
jgi:hypothetical protein